MFRVLNCLIEKHDWRLLLLAGAICFITSLAAIRLYHRAEAGSARLRGAWIALASAATGFGIWATHFSAMLAYQPGVAVRYGIGLTALSLLAATFIAGIGLAIAVPKRTWWATPLGGAIVGAGVAVMHYTGMWALQLPGRLTWSGDLIGASVVLAMLFGAAALALAGSRRGIRATIGAATLLTLAILSHHFTAMGAGEIIPDPTRTNPALSLSDTALAIAVAGAALAILITSLIGAIADRFVDLRTTQFAQVRREMMADSEAKLREQHLRLDTALNNMSQGLCMFDAAGRLVLFNQRYLDVYGFSPGQVQIGCTLQELLKLRYAVAFSTENEDEYIEGILRQIAEGKAYNKAVHLNDGRTISIMTCALADGGRVSTHEDITERHRLLQAHASAEQQLRRQKTHLDTALNNMSQALTLFDSEGRLVLHNERYLQMYGLSADKAAPGCTARDLVHLRIEAGTFFTGDPDQYVDDFMSAMRHRVGRRATRELKDGRIITVVSEPTQENGWVVTHEDITERRRVEKERDQNREFAHKVIENVPVPIAVKDARTLKYVLINRAGEQFYGIPREQMIGKTSVEVLPESSAIRVASRDLRLADLRQTELIPEHLFETPGNGTRIIASTRLPILDADGDVQYLLTAVEDRTNRKRAEAQIAHMAHHDSLTNLPNRAAFNECIAATIDQTRHGSDGFAVLSLDVDSFKEVNDVFGHDVGDALLRELASRMQTTAQGAFVARIGGDEFMLIAADGPQPQNASVLAERLLTCVAQDIELLGHRLRVGLSIGVAVFPTDGEDQQTLLASAASALYRAKAAGRGVVQFFEADMDRQLRDRRALQRDLLLAVDRGELCLHYQPQAHMAGAIVGFEALVRWNHPSRGMVPPGKFIPVAEESGLIIPLGEWILREACREAASWPEKLQIAINLSPIQFRHGDLPGLVHSILLETGLSPDRLEFEITEGVLIDDFSRATSTLRRLKLLGVRIAMDDFGTGYSSLSYLQAFPFDKIKIDQSFISNLERSAQSATIVRAVIGLARGLGLPVVAEGVETEEQIAFLARERCDKVQGYIVGRPLPIEEYDHLTGRTNRPKPIQAANASEECRVADPEELQSISMEGSQVASGGNRNTSSRTAIPKYT
jgi:diguanylate cyclase (GGDEF)-like protein/PAS domain S-box-containing protein